MDFFGYWLEWMVCLSLVSGDVFVAVLLALDVFVSEKCYELLHVYFS